MLNISVCLCDLHHRKSCLVVGDDPVGYHCFFGLHAILIGIVKRYLTNSYIKCACDLIYLQNMDV